MSRYSLDLSGCVGELDGERFRFQICRIFRVLVSNGECAQELADGIDLSVCVGELDGERFWFQFAEFSGFWSAMANVPKSLLMV